MNETRVLTPGEPLPAARPVAVSRQSLLRRLWVDRLTRQLVTLGGVVIIGSILAILLVMMLLLPLFSKKERTRQKRLLGLKKHDRVGPPRFRPWASWR